MKRKYDIPKSFDIDGELVDRMAVYALKWHYNAAVEDMDNFVLHQRGHPDDYERNLKLKEHFAAILKYWGESV
jgi:hypothetical protein